LGKEQSEREVMGLVARLLDEGEREQNQPAEAR
jgi:hypothetical protein